MKYIDALKLVNKARCPDRGYRLPGREGRTRLVERDNGIAIRYTHTDVVLIHPDDSVTLNSGYWNTKTTRDRMGYAEPVNVFTVDKYMYVTRAEYSRSSDFVWEFKDGMTFNSKGTRCLNAAQLGVRKWSRSAWQRHVKDLRNERARKRRLGKKNVDEWRAAQQKHVKEIAIASGVHAEPVRVNAPRRSQDELRSILTLVRGGQ